MEKPIPATGKTISGTVNKRSFWPKRSRFLRWRPSQPTVAGAGKIGRCRGSRHAGVIAPIGRRKCTPTISGAGWSISRSASTQPAALQREHVISYLEWRKTHGGKKHGGHRNTAIHEIKFLGQLMDQAINRGYATNNPC